MKDRVILSFGYFRPLVFLGRVSKRDGSNRITLEILSSDGTTFDKSVIKWSKKWVSPIAVFASSEGALGAKLENVGIHFSSSSSSVNDIKEEPPSQLGKGPSKGLRGPRLNLPWRLLGRDWKVRKGKKMEKTMMLVAYCWGRTSEGKNGEINGRASRSDTFAKLEERSVARKGERINGSLMMKLKV
ncbi:hypothetical protein Fot_03811 [Forsythia ovata]|uniref:Uncharacterized protein n=1 Tax=Forsythia ovata TaxID=205694 RepID=A0ABD1XAU7_9LAMI